MWTQIKTWFSFQDGLHTSNKAELNTKGTVFPEAAIQATSIQARWLQPLLNHSTKFMYFVKMLYGLFFVPPDQVVDIFDIMLMDHLDILRQEEGFKHFAKELEDFVSYL